MTTPDIPALLAQAAHIWDNAGQAVCLDCGDAIHNGNTCIECWRDRRELASARDKEWWS